MAKKKGVVGFDEVNPMYTLVYKGTNLPVVENDHLLTFATRRAARNCKLSGEKVVKVKLVVA